MKKIILVRHGRAEDQTPDLPDFERSLTLKGKSVSRLIARKLREKEKSIGVIVTSPAFRAYETAIIFAGEYGINPEEIIINSNLFFSINENSFMEILKSINEDVSTITLFGHNPSFTELAGNFCKDFCEIIPKSGVVCLSFKTKIWSGVKHDTGDLDFFLIPKKVL
jgi:phosphohistidine phosphatase